jgi:hypothetical protein
VRRREVGELVASAVSAGDEMIGDGLVSRGER